MNGIKNQILDYNNLSKEYNSLIKSVFADSSIKKIFRYVDQLSMNNSLKLHKRFYLEFNSIYEKEESVDKFFFMRVVDKFTNYGWTNPGFYNRVMSDYEKLFDSFSSNEHAQLINFFARVDLDKEDVILAAPRAHHVQEGSCCLGIQPPHLGVKLNCSRRRANPLFFFSYPRMGADVVYACVQVIMPPTRTLKPCHPG